MTATVTSDMARAARDACRQISDEAMQSARDYRADLGASMPGEDLRELLADDLDTARYWRRMSWRFGRLVPAAPTPAEPAAACPYCGLVDPEPDTHIAGRRCAAEVGAHRCAELLTDPDGYRARCTHRAGANHWHRGSARERVRLGVAVEDREQCMTLGPCDARAWANGYCGTHQPDPGMRAVYNRA